MKVEISNPNGWVERVQLIEMPDTFSVHITTSTRHHTPESEMWDSNDSSVTYSFSDPEDEIDLYDDVKLIPETDLDRYRLRWLHFKRCDKDQLWIIYIRDELCYEMPWLRSQNDKL